MVITSQDITQFLFWAYTFASKLKFSFQILWTSERVIFFARWKDVLLVSYSTSTSGRNHSRYGRNDVGETRSGRNDVGETRCGRNLLYNA